jgi:hypothetical protein
LLQYTRAATHADAIIARTTGLQLLLLLLLLLLPHLLTLFSAAHAAHVVVTSSHEPFTKEPQQCWLCVCSQSLLQRTGPAVLSFGPGQSMAVPQQLW